MQSGHTKQLLQVTMTSTLPRACEDMQLHGNLAGQSRVHSIELSTQDEGRFRNQKHACMTLAEPRCIATSQDCMHSCLLKKFDARFAGTLEGIQGV